MTPPISATPLAAGIGLQICSLKIPQAAKLRAASCMLPTRRPRMAGLQLSIFIITVIDGLFQMACSLLLNAPCTWCILELRLTDRTTWKSCGIMQTIRQIRHITDAGNGSPRYPRAKYDFRALRRITSRLCHLSNLKLPPSGLSSC